MSDLRDRIAAVMHDHLLHRGFHVECACGWVSQEPGRTTVDHDAHVADAVIAALDSRGWLIDPESGDRRRRASNRRWLKGKVDGG